MPAPGAESLEAVALENAFVRLDPIEERHRDALRAAGHDPDLWRYASVNQHNSDFDAWFDERRAAILAARDITWAVFDKASGGYAGSTSYLQASLAHKRVEIGWTWYAKSYWASAVNPACKRLLFEHGFDRLALNRIELKLDATNQRSFKAVERLGAQFEGVHRAHMVMADGRVRDTAWFSVLRAEWPVVRAGLDERLAAFTAP